MLALMNDPPRNPHPTQPERFDTIDMHFHVGVRGDRHPKWGCISDALRRMRPKYDIFLHYAGLKMGEDKDDVMERRALEIIDGCQYADRVVCLALDHVWDKNGTPRPGDSHFWVANEYVLHLRQQLPLKILFGASLHPYRPDFCERVTEAVEQGAVLLKWFPSGQQFTLADPVVRKALKFLATARSGRALPLLLHTGVEYAIPTTDERTGSYDYLSWGHWDDVRNSKRPVKWHVPNVTEVWRTLDEALREGAVIILAHAGLPYIFPHSQRAEHDDFSVVRRYLEGSAAGWFGKGRVYADLSACATPPRWLYYPQLKTLPPELLLFGSDSPSPAFRLFHRDFVEADLEFRAAIVGDLARVPAPGNLVDLNYQALSHHFPGHAMFTNFDRLLKQPVPASVPAVR
jgi:predicted TIM-barrel fold metal-dependent hydrolase